MDILAIVSWVSDNWAMIVALAPPLGVVVAVVAQKAGRIGVIVWDLADAMRDHEITDEEAATFLWMIAAVALGLWSNVSIWVLDFAPDHQIARLKAKKFIGDSYRPTVAPAKL